jgi:subtilisin family serine protease
MSAQCSAETLTMLAPGVSITAAGLTMSGTSQATPFVAASLALLRSRFPAYTNAQIVAALTTTGVPVSS